MSYVLDSSGVVAWLKAEYGGRRVAEVLASRVGVAIHAVNLVEVNYFFMRRSVPEEHAAERLKASAVEIVQSIDDEMLSIASRLKAHQTPIALGDTFAVALAVTRDATLLTTDRAELEKIMAAGLCEIEFLR